MVQLDVKINEWFRSFYDMLQKALAKPGSITIEEFYGD
jgi:peptide/bleomycin uptake transporter